MNRNVKNSFMTIQGAATNFQKNVADALMRYKSDRDAARSEAAQFKNEEEKFTAMNSALVANCRNRIKTAEQSFTGTVKTELETLRKEFNMHLLMLPDSRFLTMLGVYRTFCIAPSRAELNALVEASGGVTLGLRAINALLDSVNSDFRIQFEDSAAMEKDLDSLERLTFGDFGYCPAEMLSEATAVYGGQEVTYHGPGGAYQDGARWDSVRLLTARAVFENQVKNLSEMEKRWSESVVPSVVTKSEFYKGDDADAEYNADLKKVSDSVQIERNPAAPTITPANRTAEIMANYTK